MKRVFRGKDFFTEHDKSGASSVMLSVIMPSCRSTLPFIFPRLQQTLICFPGVHVIVRHRIVHLNGRQFLTMAFNHAATTFIPCGRQQFGEKAGIEEDRITPPAVIERSDDTQSHYSPGSDESVDHLWRDQWLITQHNQS